MYKAIFNCKRARVVLKEAGARFMGVRAARKAAAARIGRPSSGARLSR
jgi:hypothetical protein